MLRPMLNQAYFYDVYDICHKMDIPLEGWHTETGPGVLEAAITYTDAVALADRALLFKTTVKQIGLKHGVMPSFMAKVKKMVERGRDGGGLKDGPCERDIRWRYLKLISPVVSLFHIKPHTGLPGCSGHIHVSLSSLSSHSSNNLFASSTIDPTTPLNNLSSLGKHFLAGVLKGLPSIMCILAPNINSYKRLVANFWAPINVTYGFENRTAAVRVIAPPSCPPSATRLEMRVSGADGQCE